MAPTLYYTSATQVAALMPSNTPLGTGTITVTNNGQVGNPAPITVVQNNVGIFTATSDGQGAGIVTYPDYSLVSPVKAANCGGVYTTCGAANPGDTLTVWATGLGPVSGNETAGAGLGVDMTSVDAKLWLGGIQAQIVFKGRGCCIGEDQIAFVVPDNAPTGCAVPHGDSDRRPGQQLRCNSRRAEGHSHLYSVQFEFRRQIGFNAHHQHLAHYLRAIRPLATAEHQLSRAH